MANTQSQKSTRERILLRNEKIAKLRERSGLSMNELANRMGFKGQSSIQRYLSPDYDKGFRPEIADKFKAALVGLGDPPITPSEVEVFDNWAETSGGETLELREVHTASIEAGKSTEEYIEFLAQLGLHPRSGLSTVLSQMRRSRTLGVDENSFVVGLPMAEGDVVLKMPKHISQESAGALRDWLNHLINLSLVGDDKKQK